MRRARAKAAVNKADTRAGAGDFLERVVALRRARLEEERRRLPEALLETRLQAARQAGATPRSLAAALAPLAPMPGGVAIIAEIKRGSASLGPAFLAVEAGEQARLYARAGAAAISVVGERDFFYGRPEDDVAAAAAAGPPVLFKDFVLDPYQVRWARNLGADAVLLLAAIASRAELTRQLGAATELGMDALVEVHDEAELELALAAGALLIGVNNRDLRSFAVDLATAERLAPRIPDGILRVAESGIAGRSDIERLLACGYRAFLVGESLLRSADPVATIATLRGEIG